MEQRELTVGFADIADFMRIQNEQGESAMLEALNAFYKLAGDEIYAHGGRIVKYIGDAILFTFPEPIAAMAAARAIAATEIAGQSIHLSLATGSVYEGDVGHPDFRSPDILGETVNKAGLLLQEAKDWPEHIAMCEETQARTA